MPSLRVTAAPALLAISAVGSPLPGQTPTTLDRIPIYTGATRQPDREAAAASPEETLRTVRVYRVAAAIEDVYRRSGFAAARADVEVHHERLRGAALLDAIRNADVVVVVRDRTPFKADLIAQLPKLRLFLFTGARNTQFDAAAPRWPDRDRLVLSAGHGSMLLYGLLYLTGYPDMDLVQIKNFRPWGSRTPGHPEYRHAEGIETTTGPLGQGLGNAVGMALAERMLAARFPGLVDHYTYVIAGDGDLMEGISQEAISLAGHLRLSRLIVLFDDNSVSIDGSTSLATSDDQLARFRASGWAAERVNGHDMEEVAAAIARAREHDRPSLIACRTVIGFGAPSKEGTAATHGSPLGAEEVTAARARQGWPHRPFELPEPVLDARPRLGPSGSHDGRV